MATDKVWVRPGRLPAIIRVAPNSPSARANASSTPAAMPRAAKGKVTRKHTPASPTPSTRAAFSSWLSTFSKAARADLNTSGKATTDAAITAPCQVNTNSMPHPASVSPMTPRRPSKTSR
ncbi:hypothetical protein G6F35_015621 [Rhizopus arrhizus]|nr:hypothetical protein G6F35_015621 [Rhizopus arrhizus]